MKEQSIREKLMEKRDKKDRSYIVLNLGFLNGHHSAIACKNLPTIFLLIFKGNAMLSGGYQYRWLSS